MNAVLPFDGFLDVLRTKGYAVGLRERFALARLLEHWKGTSSTEFRDAVAALIGRSEEEVQGIRRLFNDLYRDPVEEPVGPAGSGASPMPAEPTAPPKVRTFGSRRAWVAAALAVVILLGFVVWRINRPEAPAPAPTLPAVEAPSAAPAVPELQTTAVPPPPAPPVPAPPSILDSRFVWGACGATFLVAVLVFWFLKRREARRLWLRELWSARFSALRGPHHFSLTIRGRPGGLARRDVEDAATLLGRVFATQASARELDVQRSVRLTLRHGLFPRIVFKQRRVTEPILVFQDVCQDMDLWRPKVEKFLTDVAGQGVTLERYYFDGDIRRLTHRPHRGPAPFDLVMRRRPDAPVLVISTGTTLAAALDQADDRWLVALRNRARRSWLSPLVDVRLWPTELGTLPVHAWPMTRRGLTQAAKGLAGIQGEAPTALRARIASEGLVTADDIERVKRLASLVPHPTLELLEVLRLRFAPDVSDAVFVHLFAETGSQPAPVLRLSDEEVQRCLNAVRGETPRLEAAVRQVIVEALRDSEPPAGSAAHLRWQTAVSLQDLVLADLQGADTTRPLVALRELGQGPTWEETRRAARLVPNAPTLTEKIDAALGPAVGGTGRSVPPSGADQTGSRPPWSWVWPGRREIVSAAVLASFVFIGDRQLHLSPARTIFHVEDAYRVEYVPDAQSTNGHLLVQVREPSDATLPQRVDLYQENQIFRTGIAVSRNESSGAQEPGGIPLAASETGRYYQARAQLPEGNMALSNALWVPSSTLVTVLIDAWPWAQVTVQGATEDIRDQPTPFFIALAPGAYRLHFENTSLKLTMDKDIIVSSSTNTFRYPMPGFDARAAAAGLVRTPGSLPTLAPPTAVPPATHLLTIDPRPTGGTIQSVGILCGTKDYTCSARQPEGVQVALIPTPDPEYTFMEFVGDCAPSGLTQMTAPRTCSARFSPLPAFPLPAVSAAPAAQSRSAPAGPGGASQGVALGGQSTELPALPPISAEEFEKGKIREVLTAYCKAISDLSPDGVKAVYPTVNMASSRIQLNKREYKSATCKFSEPEFVTLDPSKGTAEVRVDLKQYYVHTGPGKPETVESIVSINLSRPVVRMPWRIDMMRFTPKK